MSREYDNYLTEHKGNVARGFHWIQEHLPELIPVEDGVDYEHQICFAHDKSKNEPDEYDVTMLIFTEETDRSRWFKISITLG